MRSTDTPDGCDVRPGGNTNPSGSRLRRGLAGVCVALAVASSGRAAAQTLNQNTSYTIDRPGTSTTYRVVAYGDSIDAGFLSTCFDDIGDCFNVAKRSAPWVLGEYLSTLWNADIEVVRRMKSGALADDVYSSKIRGERLFMQDSRTRVVTFEMCGNDYLNARWSFQSGCDAGVLDAALADCTQYMRLAMEEINQDADADTQLKVISNLYYTGYDSDSGGTCPDPFTGQPVWTQDVFLEILARSNWRACTLAEQYGFACADSFAEFMGADYDSDGDGSVDSEALRYQSGESEDDYVNRIAVLLRPTIRDPDMHLADAGTAYDYMQSDDIHPTYFGLTIPISSSLQGAPDFSDGQISVGKNPEWNRWGHERLGWALSRFAAVKCGNGSLDFGETCDDGNTAGGDGCGATCQLEACYTCPNPGQPCTLAAPGTACTDDNVCTDDACDDAGHCLGTPNTAPCDDGVFCNGVDTCSGGSCSVHGGDPCVGGGECANVPCDETTRCLVPAGTGCVSDNNPCTVDQCDGNGRCGHEPGNAGTLCRPAAGPCDAAETCDGSSPTCPQDIFQPDGTSCGTLDTCGACQAGTCQPTRAGCCGNGIVEPGEQCDDGNRTAGDGCDHHCNYELIPGDGNGSTNLDRRACRVEWSVINPANAQEMDAHGRPSFVQTCHNNDPSCDYGSDPDACEFRVVACLNNMDPQLPNCSAEGVRDPLRVFLGGTARDSQNRDAVTSALGNLRDPRSGVAGFALPLGDAQVGMCTAPFAIRVPLRGSGTKRFAGRGRLVTISRAPQGAAQRRADVDRLNLVCTP